MPRPVRPGPGIFDLVEGSDRTGNEDRRIHGKPAEGRPDHRPGGSSPRWSHDRNELYYRNGDTIMVVDVETVSTFSFRNHRVLFQGSYYSTDQLQMEYTPWDISPDGKRFLMIKEDLPTKINIILNWFEDLKEKGLVQ